MVSANICTCRPWPDDIPIDAVRYGAHWEWICPHGNKFIRQDPSWGRVLNRKAVAREASEAPQ